MGQETFLTIPLGGVYDARHVGVKVAVVGGGSTYTPELVEGFATRASRLPVDELVLFDIDEERLRVVGGLAERQLRRARGARRPGRATPRGGPPPRARLLGVPPRG